MPQHCTGNQQLSVGDVIKGEAPPSRGGVREVSQHTLKADNNPHNMQMLQNHADAQKSIGPKGGMYTPGGVQTYGAYKCMGVYKCGGIQTPPSIKTCLPLKSRKKTLFKAKFQHLKSWKKY